MNPENKTKKKRLIFKEVVNGNIYGFISIVTEWKLALFY